MYPPPLDVHRLTYLSYNNHNRDPVPIKPEKHIQESSRSPAHVSFVMTCTRQESGSHSGDPCLLRSIIHVHGDRLRLSRINARALAQQCTCLPPQTEPARPPFLALSFVVILDGMIMNFPVFFFPTTPELRFMAETLAALSEPIKWAVRLFGRWR